MKLPTVYTYVCCADEFALVYYTLSPVDGEHLHNPQCEYVNGPWEACEQPWAGSAAFSDEYATEEAAILAMVLRK